MYLFQTVDHTVTLIFLGLFPWWFAAVTNGTPSLRPDRRPRPCALWASFPFKTSRVQWLPTGTLRKWNPRPACGAAISSVRVSISVFGLAPTRDEPAECLPWTRRTGVCRYLPCFGDVSVRSGQQMAYATRSGMFVSFLEFQVGSRLYVTAAVKAASHIGTAYAQRPKLVQGSLEPVATLGAHTACTLKRGRSPRSLQ